MADQVTITEHKATGRLQRYVRRLVAIDAARAILYKSAIAPTGYAYLLWILEGRQVAKQGEKVLINLAAPSMFLGGALSRAPVQVDYVGPFREVIVEFTATGLYELLGVCGNEIAGAGRTLESVGTNRLNPLKNSPSEYSRKLASAPTSKLAVKVVQDRLLDLVATARVAPLIVTQTVSYFERTHGAGRVSEIANELGVSTVHLRRLFSQIVGVPPKSFANSLMFSHAMESLLGPDDVDIGNVALSSGYYDQAHFGNVVKRITGKSVGRNQKGDRTYPDELFRRLPDFPTTR